MATLKNVQMGWKGLQDVINRIIDTVNSQTPVEGSGVRIVDTSNGKLISVADKKKSCVNLSPGLPSFERSVSTLLFSVKSALSSD